MSNTTQTVIQNGFWLAIGGALTAVVQRLLSRPDRVAEAETRLRGEYRTDIDKLREDIKHLSAEVERWRGQFYVLLDATVRGDTRRVQSLLDEYVNYAEWKPSHTDDC